MNIEDYFVEMEEVPKRKFSPHFNFIAYDKIEKKYIQQECSRDYWGEWDVWENLVDRKNATVFCPQYSRGCIKCDTLDALETARSALECYGIDDDEKLKDGRIDRTDDLKFIPIFTFWR